MDSPWINSLANPQANPVAGAQTMPIGAAGPAPPARHIPMGIPPPGGERERQRLTEVNENPSQGFATMLPSEYKFSILRQPCFPLDDMGFPPTEPKEPTIGYDEDASSYNVKKATYDAEYAAYKLGLTKWQATIAVNFAHFGGCRWGHPDGASKVLALGGIHGREDDPPMDVTIARTIRDRLVALSMNQAAPRPYPPAAVPGSRHRAILRGDDAEGAHNQAAAHD